MKERFLYVAQFESPFCLPQMHPRCQVQSEIFASFSLSFTMPLYLFIYFQFSCPVRYSGTVNTAARKKNRTVTMPTPWKTSGPPPPPKKKKNTLKSRLASNRNLQDWKIKPIRSGPSDLWCFSSLHHLSPAILFIHASRSMHKAIFNTSLCGTLGQMMKCNGFIGQVSRVSVCLNSSFNHQQK